MGLNIQDYFREENKRTIELRWYKKRIAPWDKIQPEDIVYFKDSDEPVMVIATAKVSNVLQFSNLNKKQFTDIMGKYADKTCFKTKEYIITNWTP